MWVDGIREMQQVLREIVASRGERQPQDHCFPETLAKIQGHLSDAYDSWRTGTDTLDLSLHESSGSVAFGMFDVTLRDGSISIAHPDGREERLIDYVRRTGFAIRPEGLVAELGAAIIKILAFCETAGADIAAVLEGLMEFEAKREDFEYP